MLAFYIDSGIDAVFTGAEQKERTMLADEYFSPLSRPPVLRFIFLTHCLDFQALYPQPTNFVTQRLLGIFLFSLPSQLSLNSSTRRLGSLLLSMRYMKT